mmetsp:Transcript_22755/g.47267  ORF Transcript_22755/g.47267 Transcript_22755/m.47267 type:complete len:132 (+) Transcript_22755:698-1093(+)
MSCRVKPVPNLLFWLDRWRENRDKKTRLRSLLTIRALAFSRGGSSVQKGWCRFTTESEHYAIATAGLYSNLFAAVFNLGSCVQALMGMLWLSVQRRVDMYRTMTMALLVSAWPLCWEKAMVLPDWNRASRF